MYASEDTDELVRNKGFKGGFCEMIRPFGETVPGKVVIRDSVGSSRAWEDYGVRFVDLKGFGQTSAGRDSGRDSPVAQIEEVLGKQLESTDGSLGGSLPSKDVLGSPATTPLSKLFLRQLLSATAAGPHETFSHPVASVIAISSRSPAPLETLRQLYAESSTGDSRLPDWANQEYLRYYVLVHDEERDDITESTKLYDQMKRHFGLHCHLLRLRSSHCVVTDDDSVQVPQCEWLSPQERLSGAGESGVYLYCLHILIISNSLLRDPRGPWNRWCSLPFRFRRHRNQDVHSGTHCPVSDTLHGESSCGLERTSRISEAWYQRSFHVNVAAMGRLRFQLAIQHCWIVWRRKRELRLRAELLSSGHPGGHPTEDG